MNLKLLTGTALLVAMAAPLLSQTASSQTTAKKVYMITDMEGVHGIFNWEEQCRPYQSPRWAESVKLLTGEVNAAVDGLMAGGATEVVVADLHNSSRTLSTLDVDPRAKLLQGKTIPPKLGLDASYSAVIFVGQHAMAGAPNAVIPHSGSFVIENMWLNNMLVGEIATRVLLGGYYGVPAIMLAGDTAACKELRDLVPGAECAEVKTALSPESGISLSHAAACALIRQKAQRAMKRLAEFKPYRLTGPVELKVQFKKGNSAPHPTKPGTERIDDLNVVYRGTDLLDGWLKWGDF
jgi:D-amino peptidase